MNLPLETARRSAVRSAQHIVALARRCGEQGVLHKVEFVSTIGVGGKGGGEVPERWIHETRAFHNTYEEAKAEAEDIIEKESQRGLPVTVHRPSMVVGDSTTGKIMHFQIFYHLCEFLSGRRTLGVLPNVRGFPLDIIPSDYVATALAWSSTQERTAGRVLHLCSGPDGAIDLMDLMGRVREIFQSCGKRLPTTKIIPVSLFKAAIPVISVLVSAKARRSLRALPVFLDYLSEKQVFINRDTRQILAEAGIPIPKTGHYLSRVLFPYLNHSAKPHSS